MFTWKTIPLVLGLGALAAFLLTQHFHHTLAVLPWIILLLCPLHMLFHHHGDRTHGHEGHSTMAKGIESESDNPTH